MRMEFNHTVEVQFVMRRDTTCSVNMAFDYVAFYGLSTRQGPRNGSISMPNPRTFTYTPRRGFTGEDRFIMDATGAYVNWQTGTEGPRSKAGMAITVRVE
jgi:hypothetical protein